MNSPTTQLKGNKVLLIALALGIFTAIMTWYYLDNKEKELSGGRQIKILIAAQDIPSGDPISPDALEISTFPEKYIQPNMIYPSNRTFLINQIVKIGIQKGQALLWDYLLVTTEGGLPLEMGERALTLSCDEISGVANLIKPNNKIDILGTFEVRGQDQSESATKVLLQNVTVLAVGNITGDAEALPDFLGGDKKKDRYDTVRPYDSITLKVTPAEAELLTFAEDRGKLRFVLRGSGDIEIYEELPIVKFNNIFEVEKELTITRKVYQKRKRTEEPKPTQPTGPAIYEGGVRVDR